ncbi:ADP-ribose pyrophosphatase [Bryocella elongata]|uniref:GDP-mannose pyrophosphatase n=1 Tax=Bryocella elongata TaxID=863522 RepID=A0A1H5ZPI1_9BACT|nr:NUDIX hydrolase [Bryocella elongata]SEG37655.1 ADP-ribose pyrophosphatase [Bryocella elongata]
MPTPSKKTVAKKTPAKKTGDKKAARTANTAQVVAVAHAKPLKLRGKGKTLSSKTVFKGNVFSVTRDQVQEPGGVVAQRDVIRHNGSVVILAVDTSKGLEDPGILLIRQWRHAADQFLLELPAGRIEPGEKLIPAGKRELIEETGYRAKKWSKHVRYFASPGFLSEAMNVVLAEDLTLGEATPEEDEKIEIHMTPLSEVLAMIRAGKLLDGKTITSVLLYEELRRAGKS